MKSDSLYVAIVKSGLPITLGIILLAGSNIWRDRQTTARFERIEASVARCEGRH